VAGHEAGSLGARAAVSTSRTIPCSTTTSVCRSISSTWHGCTGRRTGSRGRRTCWSGSVWRPAATTCRRRSAGACARRSRSPGIRAALRGAAGRRAVRWGWTSRGGRPCSPGPGGGGVGGGGPVSTHQTEYLAQANRCVGLRDGGWCTTGADVEGRGGDPGVNARLRVDDTGQHAPSPCAAPPMRILRDAIRVAAQVCGEHRRHVCGRVGGSIAPGLRGGGLPASPQGPLELIHVELQVGAEQKLSYFLRR